MKQRYDKIPIRTVDTDVIVLAVTSAQRINITELWIAFCARKNFRYLPTHEMANALCLDRCVTLQCLMPSDSVVVTCCHILEAGANGLHGTCGVSMMKSHQLFVLWLLPRRPQMIGCVHWNDC